MGGVSFFKKLLLVVVVFALGQFVLFMIGTKQETSPNLPGVGKTNDVQQDLLVANSQDFKEARMQMQAEALKDSGRNGTRDLQYLNKRNLQTESTLFHKKGSSYVGTHISHEDDGLSKRRVRFDGTWNSSFASAKYHTHFNINCSALVYGNRKAVQHANKLMGKSNGDFPLPPDETVQTWTKNCEVFRGERHYPGNPQSQEEADFPIAFIIVTHKDSAQVERLLRSIYQPQNVYCIHPDAKSPPAFQNAIQGIVSCFDNVFIASKIEDVQYAGFSRLQADINCMSDLLQHPVQWRYALNLCGQDFPLKTNLEMVRQLKAYGNKNDINGILPPPYIKGRTRSHFTVVKGKMTATRLRKSPAPHNLTIYFGNAYYAASRAFVDYVINDRVAVDLLQWSADTFSPDEHYWVTLNRAPGVPGGYHNATWDANVRFMKWGDIPKHPPCQGKYVRALCVFGVGYLNYLTKMTHLFANKFYYSFDPVIFQCVEELLDFRTAHPETITEFVPNFPVTDMAWQLN